MSIQDLDNLSSIDNSASNISIGAHVEVLYGSEKKEKARILELQKILSITVRENIFGTLPTLTLVLKDSGTIFYDEGFEHGKIIYVKMTPELSINDISEQTDVTTLDPPIFECSFVIQSIEYLHETNNQGYHKCFIHGIYNAEGYMNSIFTWPSPNPTIDTVTLTNAGLMSDFTPGIKSGGMDSKTLLSRIVSDAGLKFTYDVPSLPIPCDKMYWYNKNLTYYEFIRFVMDHAWLSDDDCPLFYVNRAGQGVYTSIKTLQNNASSVTYIDAGKDMSSNDPKLGKNNVRVYKSFQMKNAGYIQNEGGYVNETNVYNPYTMLGINPAPKIETDLGTTNCLPVKMSLYSIPDYHNRSATHGTNKTYIGKLTNKSPNSSSNIRYANNEMYFSQTHQYYDYAPLHHKSHRKSFFNVFLYLDVNATFEHSFTGNEKDVDVQLKKTEETLPRLNLGSKITVEFNDLAHPLNSINNGDFIVGSIIHNWLQGGNYQQIICGISDGINGTEKKPEDKEK